MAAGMRPRSGRRTGGGERQERERDEVDRDARRAHERSEAHPHTEQFGKKAEGGAGDRASC